MDRGARWPFVRLRGGPRDDLCSPLPPSGPDQASAETSQHHYKNEPAHEVLAAIRGHEDRYSNDDPARITAQSRRPFLRRPRRSWAGSVGRLHEDHPIRLLPHIDHLSSLFDFSIMQSSPASAPHWLQGYLASAGAPRGAGRGAARHRCGRRVREYGRAA